jgi:hypothetical protein
MSVWIELRCEDSAEYHARPVRLPGGERSECWSHDNCGSGDMASAVSQKSVLETYKYVVKDALKFGWKKINGEWVCPHCIKYGHEKK